MASWTYNGPEQAVPELGAQDETGGTLILRAGQSYDFPAAPPGDPMLWTAAAPAKAPKTAPVPPAAPSLPQEPAAEQNEDATAASGS